MRILTFGVLSLASKGVAFPRLFNQSQGLGTTVGRSVHKVQIAMQSTSKDVPTTTEGWKTVLSPEQFAVLRQKATEPPGYSEGKAGELEYVLKEKYGTKYPKEGTYSCAGCGTPLYAATTKFDSGCGWPVS